MAERSMDGLHDIRLQRSGTASHDEPGTRPAITARMQRTLASSIGCAGIGLHSGSVVQMTLYPGEVGTGISFVRTDLPAWQATVAARHDRVVDTRLCTVIGQGATRIATVEHLMAALAAAGIDNARVTLDGPELPILDGSAAPFLFLIDCAGTTTQAAPRRCIEVLRPIRVEQGAAWAELLPPAAPGLSMALSIDFAAAAIGRQSCAIQLTPDSFRRELAAARTFTLADEIAGLRATGLALGGSLDNAVVVEGAAILNPGGLRMEREFVRHKLLDAVGDLALAGHPLHAAFRAHRSGHALNNRLLTALFADPAAWRLTAEPGDWLSAA